jgi:hypothetical protein
MAISEAGGMLSVQQSRVSEWMLLRITALCFSVAEDSTLDWRQQQQQQQQQQ